jgi:large subunit ribosomal protein L1
MIRGTCILPSGTGKEIKVCVFADGEFHSELKEAGADILGNDQVLIDIGNGNVPFDKIICTQEHIQDLKKFARILGPKGLMPNTKSGTLVKADEIVEQVR